MAFVTITTRGSKEKDTHIPLNETVNFCTVKESYLKIKDTDQIGEKNACDWHHSQRVLSTM